MASDVQFTVEAVDKTSSALRTIDAGLNAFRNALGMAQQAIRVVNQVMDATVGTYVKYANQVRTITQVTGQSADAVSRMIQVADDYKISAEQLTLAMKKLAGEGKALTTDSLAKMSAEYLKLNAGVERQTYLTENFGRAGIAFAEIMLAGEDAIRAQSDAINENLILSDKAVIKARDYEKALDDLNDAAEGWKIRAGQPMVASLLDVNRAFTEQQKTLLQLKNELKNGIITVEEYNATIRRQKFNLKLLIPEVDSATQSYIAMAKAQEEAAATTDDLLEAIEPADLSSTYQGISSIAGDIMQQGKDMKTLEDELATARAQRYLEWGDHIKGIKQKIADLQAAQEEQTKQWLFNALQQQLAIDGITAAEMAFLLQYQVDTGIITQDAADRATAIWEEALRITEAVNSIPDGKTVDINLVLHGSQYMSMLSGEPAGFGDVQEKASGGPVSTRFAITGDSLDGHRTGYEELVDFDARRVYSAPQTRQMIPHFAGGGILNVPKPSGSGKFSSMFGVQTSAPSFFARNTLNTVPGDEASADAWNAALGYPAVDWGNGGASTQSLASIAATVAAPISVSAQQIEDSGERTIAATQQGTAVQAAGNQQLLTELRALRNDIKTIIPKSIGDAYQRVVGQ